MSKYDDLKAKAEKDGPLAVLNTQQAAALLGMTESALEKQRESDRRNPDSEHLVPYHHAGKRAVYYLIELLAYQKKGPFGLPMPSRGLAVMMGENVCRELGVPYPENPAQAMRRRPDAVHISQSPVRLADLLGDKKADKGKPKEIKRGPKSRKDDLARARQLQALGVDVRRNLLRFGSMDDFLRRAEPQEEWLFCCPPDARPFDFMDAVLEGNPHPFEWLTLSDYQAQLAAEAEKDRNRRLAAEEAGEIAAGLSGSSL
jgi:hypothetical protein